MPDSAYEVFNVNLLREPVQCVAGLIAALIRLVWLPWDPWDIADEWNQYKQNL